MKIKLALLTVIFAGISFVFFQVFIGDNTAAISQEEAETIAAELYNGKVVKSKEDEKDRYLISVENEKGIYQLTVNGHTKKVSNVKQIKEKKTLLSKDEAKKNIQQESNGKVIEIKKADDTTAKARVKKNNRTYKYVYDLKKQKITSSKMVKDAGKQTDKKKEHIAISRQQLMEIAKSQLNGTVTKVKKLKSDHGLVYKVTVEKEAKGAHVYVQEATKKVISVTWFSKTSSGKDDESDDTDDNEEGSDDTDGSEDNDDVDDESDD